MKKAFYSSNTIIQFTFIALFLSAFCFTFFSVWKGLINFWLDSDEYSHGFFIVPLALYIVWQKKDKISALPIKEAWSGLIVSIMALILFILGSLSHMATLKSLSMILFIAGAIIFVLGFNIFRELIFPLFVLLFMIPIPGQLYSAATIHLQLFVSAASSSVVSIFGVALYREGNIIHLPERTLQVVQACSGMRSLITMLTLGAVFGYFTLRSNLLRAIVFFSGIPIAVFINIVRVALLICSIHFLGIDLTQGTLHTIFGLCIFALALVLLYSIKELVSKWDFPSL